MKLRHVEWAGGPGQAVERLSGLELRSAAASFWGGGRGHSRGVGPAHIEPYVLDMGVREVLAGLKLGTLLLLLWRYPSAESQRLRVSCAVYLGCNETCSTVRYVLLPSSDRPNESQAPGSCGSVLCSTEGVLRTSERLL
eukprot:SAG11_NODE_7_length_31267_cov_19.541966_11_plen_139_part_00